MRLKDEHPTLFSQLHPTRNEGLDLRAVANSSNDMVWWVCPAGHEWQETPLQRRSHAMWKQGDMYACLYCVAPGCTVNSCGHRRFHPGKDSIFRVLPHPCEKCETIEHARQILDAQAESAPAAISILENSALYALFCQRGSEAVEWWDQISPAVEAYFVRILSLYIAIDTVQFRQGREWTEPVVLGACMLRIVPELPQNCHQELYSAIPADAGHFRHDYMPGVHPIELARAFKKVGFDVLDIALGRDLEGHVQFLEQQHFSTDGKAPPRDLNGRHYPPFEHIPFDRAKGASATLRQFRPIAFPMTTTAVRLTLDESAPADPDDPLGRDHVGYAPNLAPDELWERARGVWKLRADHVAASSIALAVFDRKVVLVASISGVSFHNGSVSIVGTPIPDHPLTGSPDPLHTPNPLAHGTFDQRPNKGRKPATHIDPTRKW
ncbi:zinc-ribbon domain-containing protein [Rhodococcus qingshengii]|uniref:zinc-ribbon domain-containing protein n=1 Tax=Rhodococcus qingshengii TaxID=334542 RepID=UPI0021B12999|nr:zinc-ribbon domain-containing protein [Rhodococcus qingshengii]MCT6735387.1 zinc-ribbon domain-containing protein [Rhodococcus qingshengii]